MSGFGYEPVLRRLESLKTLKANWDSYGGLPIDRDIIAAVDAFARKHFVGRPFCPHVVPCSQGHVQLEWTDNNKVMEFEFTSPTTLDVLVCPTPYSATWEEYESVSVDDPKVVEWLDWIEEEGK